MKTFVVFALLSIVCAARSEIVYDNLTNNPQSLFWADAASYTFADDVNLAGAGRTITSVDVLFEVEPAASGFSSNLTATFYQITGSGSQWTVGSVLGSWTTFINYPLFGVETATVPIPSVVVPDSFIVGFTFSNYSSDHIGLITGGTPNPGTSADREAWNQGAGWNYLSNAGATNPYNLGIRLNAASVPEPASLMGLSITAALLLRRKRQ